MIKLYKTVFTRALLDIKLFTVALTLAVLAIVGWLAYAAPDALIVISTPLLIVYMVARIGHWLDSASVDQDD